MTHSDLLVPLGTGLVPVPVPPGWSARLVEPAPREQLADLAAAIDGALARPIGSDRLQGLAAAAVARARGAGRAATAVVVVTDATRDCPDDAFLPPLLAELAGGGIEPENTSILIATGLHRASTDAEKRSMLGPAIAERYPVIDHDARDPHGIVDLGTVGRGIPATLSRMALETDVLVATGVVEPHQYAGFSGGAKTVAIGVAGEATITATHGTAMLDDPGVRLARIDGNPFQDAVRAVAARAGLAFVINVVADAEGCPVAVAAGAPGPTHDHLVSIARDLFTVAIPHQVDVAVAGVGAPKDANLYQATRAVSYLHFAPTPVVRRGGAYVLAATIPEGAGEGVGEQRFFEALRHAASPGSLVARLRAGGTRAGEQRAFIVARVLQEASIVVVGAEHPEVVSAVGLIPAATMAEGVAIATRIASGAAPGPGSVRAAGRASASTAGRSMLVVPHAIRTLPVVSGAA